LVAKERVDHMKTELQQVEEEINRVKKTVISPTSGVNDILIARGTTPIENGSTVAELIRRPQMDYASLASVDSTRPALSKRVQLLVETEVKYEGYIKRQLNDIEQQKKFENSPLPEDIDYMEINTVRIEAREKLNRVRPATLGQASRISGVSPADIGALMVYLSHRGDKK